jgi:polyisoprenoid-binding protein YceI
MSPRTELLRRRRTWLIGIPIVILLAVVVGPWVYINLIRDDPPDRVTLADRTTSTSDGTTSSSTDDATPVAADGIDGTWTVAVDGNIAGYRVDEILFGQEAEAVGRTSAVTGSLEASGTTISATEVVVDMTSIESDESRRDGQFHGRIMATAEFPTATFTLTEDIELGALPADGEEISVEATGELTLRGVTQEVTVTLAAVLDGGTVVVNGTIPIDFDDYDIPDASGGPASVGRTGELELLVVFAR